MKTRAVVNLVGHDGNAYAIICACRSAARKAGWSDAEIQLVQNEMMSGDYDHLLQVAINNFDVQ